MNNKFYQFLLENPQVYYIYNRGSLIYGLNNKKSDVDFLVVVDPKFEIPKEFKQFKTPSQFQRILKYNVKIENLDFIFYTTDEWFKKVLNCDLEAWECACLNRKFIHKEHVKLLMTTDALQLRKNFNKKYNKYLKLIPNLIQKNKIELSKHLLWELIKDIDFINQIIENHKIVNFKESNNSFKELYNSDNDNIIETFNNIINSKLSLLYKYTNGLLKKEQESIIIQNK